MLNYVLIIGGVQGILLFPVIYFKQLKHIANRFLAVFVLILGLGCFFDNNLGLVTLDIYVIVWLGNSFLLAPLLFLYLKNYKLQKHLSRTVLLHFIPFLVVKTLIVVTHFQSSFANDEIASIGTALNFSLIIYNLIYIVMTFRIVSSQKEVLDRGNLLMLAYLLLWIFAGFNLALLFRRITELAFAFEFKLFGDYLYVVVSIVIYFICFKIIFHPEILSKEEKYAKSSLEEPDIEKYGKMIEEYLMTEREYMDPKFNLTSLSNKIGLEKHKISEIIGKHFDLNFYELLNKYRIDEVCTRLHSEESSKMNILGIALDCGFKSKSTFNTAFKKIKGITPSQYLAKNKK